MANQNVTPTLLGSLQGAVIGTFTVASGLQSGQTVTVADAGVGANSVIVPVPQAVDGAVATWAVLQVNPGVSFVVQIACTATLTSGVPFWYLRFN